MANPYEELIARGFGLKSKFKPQDIEALRQLAGQSAPVQPVIDNPEQAVAEEVPVEEQGDPAKRYLSAMDIPQNKPDPEMQAMLKDSLEQQKLGLSGAKDAIKAYASAPAQLDFSPLAALADSLTKGGKTLEGYKRPQNAEEKAAGFAKLQDLSQGQRAELTNALTQMAGQKSQDRYLNEVLRQQGRETSLLKGFGKDLNDATKKINAESSDAIGKFDKLEQIYSTGDIRQITSILGDMAKYIGGNMGATSDPDAARQLLNTLEVYKAKLLTTVGEDGILPASETASMVDLIQKSRAIAKDIFKSKYRDVQNSFDFQSKLISQPQLMQPGSPAYDYLQKQIEKVDTGLSPMAARASGPKAGDIKSYGGSTYKFKGGKNIKENWELVPK